MMKKNEITIYINIFVHYPETCNAQTIANKFDAYFIENKLISGINYACCNVIINTAPHLEDEMITFDITYDEEVNALINQTVLTLKLQEWVDDFFNKKTANIIIKFREN